MSQPRADPLDVIYEDDETDEGAVSATSLHGHPDHEHTEDVHALAAENMLLHENIAELLREVSRADAEMVRWRSRCRQIEDERDAISRELDRCKAELERRSRPQPMVVYSTTESNARPDQQQSPGYRNPNSPETLPSPPLRFASPRIHALPPGASQPYNLQSLPAIAISPSPESNPPGVGVPTHRGRLGTPRTSRSPSQRDRERERKRELNRREQAEQNQFSDREQGLLLWDPSRAEPDPLSQRLERSQREVQQSQQREFERAQQEWEHVQLAREQDQHISPVVYSTGVSEEWNYFDVTRQYDTRPKDSWNLPQSPYLSPTSRSVSLSSPAQTVYSSAYPHPNGHNRGRHARVEGSPRRNLSHLDATAVSPSRDPRQLPGSLDTQVLLQQQLQLQSQQQLQLQQQQQHQLQPPLQPHPQLQQQQHPPLPQLQQLSKQRQQQQSPQPPQGPQSAPEHPEQHSTPPDDAPNTPIASNYASSTGSTSSAGSFEVPQVDALPRTPPDPTPTPPTFTFSPTSPAFTPTGLRGFSSSQVLSAASPPFQPQTPVVDPEFGPVIVHGPLPPRHAQASPNAQGQATTPQRRKREPASVPPRHLTGGKGVSPSGVFGGAAFGGAAMGMGGGVALTLGPRNGTEGDSAWAWGRR